MRISTEVGGELVNEKEILDLFGVEKGSIRQPAEVVRLVDRRLDYVQQNVSTISKQMEKIQSQLSEVLEQIDREDGPSQEPGLPMTEIIEELDEDGNVISSTLTQPENQTAQIIDTLRKAGISHVDPTEGHAKTTKTSTSAINSNQPVTSTQVKDAPKATANTANAEAKSAKKGVSFAEEVQEREIPSRADIAKTDRPPGVNPALIKGSFAPGDRVYELDDDDNLIGGAAIIPQDESPEDARLRREMLQYNLNEVGQVVAELDLEENLSEFEDDDDYLDDEYDSEISEEEDEYGRAIRPGISKSYRHQMLELEKQLRERVIGNLGPNLKEVDPVYDPEGLRRLVVQSDGKVSEETIKSATNNGNTEDAAAPAKKGVRFSEELDIQEAPKKADAPTTMTQTARPQTAPIANVVERVPTRPEPPSTQQAPTKQSRFKQNRTATPQTNSNTLPTQPQPSGPIIADKIIEHAPSTTSSAHAPQEIDELDPELQSRQLASEYYRLRNNMIRQQGGFKETDEEADDPLMEQFADGKVKKVSRFKAARMKF
jgi:unconventional prefoldin RPB5 interactor 1